VRHARVTVTSSDPPVRLSTVTGDDGAFAFTALPAGRFSVSVSKQGWLTTAYGAKRPLGPGTAVPVATGQAARVVIRMPRGAVITGALLDNTGQPAVGATVRAMRYAMINGERRLDVNGSSAIADDRGLYRIYGLPPGDYIVGASWRPSYLAKDASELRLTTERDVRDALQPSPSSAASLANRTVALASTFYPGSTNSRQAALITIGAGQERSGIDFTLQIVPTARVEGTVTWPGGEAPPGAVVSLMATEQVAFPGAPFDGYRSSGIRPDGTFAFSDVAPGQYALFARARGADAASTAQVMWASTDVLVDGDDVAGLNLMLAPGLTVTGQLRFESTTLRPPADLKTVRVTLLPVQTGSVATLSPTTTSADAKGRFTLAGVTPGRYRMAVSFPGLGTPRGWAVRSALFGDIDALDTPLTVTPATIATTALVTFTDRIARLTGTLQNATGTAAPGYTIILFPSSSSQWMPQSRRIQSARPAVDGTFSFTNLPPGDYYVAAVDDVEPGAWFDPSFLQQLVPSSMKVTIAEGEDKKQDLRVGGQH
jgi:uncharacterized protein (DUF2141 family)